MPQSCMHVSVLTLGRGVELMVSLVLPKRSLRKRLIYFEIYMRSSMFLMVCFGPEETSISIFCLFSFWVWGGLGDWGGSW
jgi:hypothetical protein